jgi:signal transduction histidine kinase
MQILSSDQLRRYRTIYIALTSLLLIITITYLAERYFESGIDRNWENISESRSETIHKTCLSIFNSYQSSTLDFSNSILSNKKLVTALTNQNIKKSYEYLTEFDRLKDFNIEVYNSRFELMVFQGRQLNPDILELSRVYAGETFSTVKEMGFYTYLLVYRPIPGSLDSSDMKPVSNASVTPAPAGILVTAKLIDIGYPLKNRFFKNSGVTQDISSQTGASVDFSFKQYQYLPSSDSTLLKDNHVYDLYGINNNTIGQIFVPRVEKSSYMEETHDKFSIVLSTELFLLSLIVLIIIFILLNNKTYDKFLGKSVALRIVLTAVTMAAFRYLWLLIEFPQKIFNYFKIEIFSPSYYASTFGFGVARSVGELLVTTVVVLLFCVYLASPLVLGYELKKNNSSTNNFKNVLFSILNIFVMFLAMQLYGDIMQSLVFDSNLKYFDKSQVVSSGQYELLFIQLAILFITMALTIILLCAGITASKFAAKVLPNVKLIRKNSVLVTFGIILIINLLFEYFFANLFSISLKLSIRNLILFISALFVYYFQRQAAVKRNYKFGTLLNVSLVVLICVIIIPVVLLNKMVSQENKYMELISRKLSEQVNDKVTFMLSSNLEDLSENTSIEKDIYNKNKSSRLAFSIWSESKLSSENLNSAVFVLDTAKRLISDFNTNPMELNSDSVINFTLRNVKAADLNLSLSSVHTRDAEDFNEDEKDESIELPEIKDMIENKELKYYSGFRPIEKTDLRNSMYSGIIGYVIMAVQYDSRNYLTQAGTDLFVNFTKDNLENKLISPPVISEFTNDELVSSSDKEISKSFLKSTDAFKESVKDKIDKSAWRYDEFENNIYKSFYALTTRNTPGSNEEKIFIVSSKINNFGVMTFFAFKYLLFVVLVYLLFLFLYIIYRTYYYLELPRKRKPFIFGYREKLFAAFFVVSVIPIIILALYTREFVENKNADFYNEQLLSDLKIVNQYIKNKIPPPNKTERFSPSLKRDENIFAGGFPESHKNFNLFVKNKLVSTTNEELYKSDILDTRISAPAYYNVVLLKKDYFVENQEIGSFKYIVGYKPVYDNFNNLVGVISSQTFFKQYEINAELTESLVYILGTYIVAVIFLVFIVNILSYRISNPVIKLLRATEQLSKGNVDVQVKSRSKDEIGDLVKSFNKMIKELKRSREELKKAERESAWRDIARQVAHEIKNPLTPIKLAVQHLAHAYNRNSKDFKEVLSTTHKLIIDQIESLNRIATEFSDFAKMPSRNYEPLKIDNLIEDVVKLFYTDGKVQFRSEINNGKVEVFGDKDEVRRALINIIRNSIQAIELKSEKNYKGVIVIDTYMSNSFYCVTIKDNGIGMDDETINKLFEPYFSTKSKGMGLGLMITKKIIDDMKGKIHVKSRLSKGTEVELKFKILHNSAKT